MTHKYFRVRDDIYDNCTDKGMKKFRTVKEIKQLFKPFHWALLGISIALLIVMVVIVFSKINDWWAIIPAIVLFIGLVVSEYRFNRFLDKDAREKELQSLSEEYEKYINSIYNILISHGINNENKRNLLKTECEMSLESHKNKYKLFGAGIFEQLIGVPVGALISSIIYKNSDAIVPKIIVVIVIGALIIGVIKLIKFVKYYADGYLKDEKLLDVLEEIEYSMNDDEICDKIVL